MPDLAEDIRALVEGGIRPLDIAEILGTNEAERKTRPVPLKASVDGVDEAQAAAASLATTGSHRSTGMRLWHKAPRTTLLSIAAAIVVLGAVGIPLLADQNSRSIRSSPIVAGSRQLGIWKLAGYISQPGWEVASSPGSSPQSLVCTSSSTCYANGLGDGAATPGSTSGTTTETVIEATHDGGVTWTASVPAPGVEIGASLSCPEVNTCMIAGSPLSASAVDNLYTTINGGQSWTSLPIPTASEGGVELSCASKSTCVGLESSSGATVQFDSLTTTDGGQHWSTSPLPATFYPYSMQCVAQRCVAVGRRANSSGNIGPGSTGMIIYSADGGTTWDAGTLPAEEASSDLLISAVSCADAHHCLAIEPIQTTQNSVRHALSTSDGGAHWVESTYTSSTPVTTDSISCSSALDCSATGSVFEPSRSGQSSTTHGYIMGTHDGGITWTEEQLPTNIQASINAMGSISCSANRCLALAQDPTTGQQVVLSNSRTTTSG
jgi:hypothetical protein